MLEDFIAERDSLYLGTANAVGQTYIQHRGGPKGFLRVLDQHTLAMADYAGNAQYISLGNLAENDKAFIFLIDYPNRQRIKIWGTARFVEDDPTLLQRVADTEYKVRPQRVLLFRVEAWDVNCPQHIRQRFTAEEMEGVVQKLQDRIADLEQENAELTLRDSWSYRRSSCERALYFGAPSWEAGGSGRAVAAAGSTASMMSRDHARQDLPARAILGIVAECESGDDDGSVRQLDFSLALFQDAAAVGRNVVRQAPLMVELQAASCGLSVELDHDGQLDHAGRRKTLVRVPGILDSTGQILGIEAEPPAEVFGQAIQFVYW